jgi:integrase/recombinase XerC
MTTTLLKRADYLATNKKVMIAKAINERDVEVLWQFLESYLQSNQKSANTVKSYRAKVKRLLSDHWRGVNWLRPTRDDVRLALRPLQDKSAATQSAHFSAYAALYDMLLDAELADAQPFNSSTRKMLKKDGTQGYKRKPYTTDELTRLVEATDSVDLKVALVLAGWVGLRVSEVVSLRWGDVDLSRRMVDVTASKGNKSRSSAIVAPAYELLSQYKGADEQPVVAFTAQFATVGVRTDALRAELKALCQAAGVKWRGIHSLRHHSATTLLTAGATLRAVSQQLGHSSTQVTEDYLHLNEVSSLLNVSL